MSKRGRKRQLTRAYWREQVDRWRESGLGQAEFSRQAGISLKSLGYWKRKFEREHIPEAATPTIVAVQRVHVQAPLATRPIILHTPNGFRLEIDGDFHPQVLEKLLQTLDWQG